MKHSACRHFTHRGRRSPFIHHATYHSCKPGPQCDSSSIENKTKNSNSILCILRTSVSFSFILDRSLLLYSPSAQLHYYLLILSPSLSFPVVQMPRVFPSLYSLFIMSWTYHPYRCIPSLRFSIFLFHHAPLPSEVSAFRLNSPHIAVLFLGLLDTFHVQ